MSIDDYIEELKMFMIDPRYEKLQSIINNILKLNVDNETIVKLYNDVVDDYDNKIEALQGQIDKLKKENSELRKENNELKNHIKEQDKRILKLEQDVFERDNIIQNLKKEIAELKNDKIINKMLTSLQDLNALDELEINLDTYLSKCYYDLRNDRNSVNHYIRLEGDRADPEHVIKYKKFILYQVLTNVNEDVKEYFEDLYGEGMIDGTIKYLEGVIDRDIQVSEKEQRKVKRWWMIG